MNLNETKKDGMIARIIEWSINNKTLVIIFTVMLMAAGIWAIKNTAVDAIPDLSDVQVIVMTNYPGQGPKIVEDQVTYPLTTKMLSVPGSVDVRGYSFFGFSMVYIIFKDGTDLYWARSRVLEYLSSMQSSLPEGVTPELGPDATGLGWVYEYVLKSKTQDLQQLRTVQDWFLKYELMTVPGVSEVASIGGFVKQYQIDVDPIKLASYDLSLDKIKMAVKKSNNDVGGRLLEMGEMEFMVRGLGYIKNKQDLQMVPVGLNKETGTPIYLKDVANVVVGPELRRGLADWNGKGEVVGGIVVQRYGANGLKVINQVKKKIDELKGSLPPGVEIITAYDRSGLISKAIKNLQDKLLEEILVVSLVIFIFLLHFRSSFVAVFTLPTAVLGALLIMHLQGINANIMSLGGIAIAIGAMVDAAIIMVENAQSHVLHNQMLPPEQQKPHWAVILDASKEVGPSIFFSLLVIVVSFLPVFALGAQEGRMFKPLAFTKSYSMAVGAILSITIVPVLMGYFIRGKMKKEDDNPITKSLMRAYEPIVGFVIRKRWWVLIISGLVVMASWYPYSKLGSEFMPPLYEGDLVYMPTTLPGISITKARQLLQQTDKIIESFPEVESVMGKVGRASTATDPAPLSMIETTIQLKPQSEWPKGMTPKLLVNKLDEAVKIPGLTNAWTMPIKTRIDMLSTGIKTPVGIKITGPDLEVLQSLGEKIEGVLRNVPGTRSVFAERAEGGNYIDFDIDRDAIARYGLTVGNVEDIFQSAIGGMNITKTIEGLQRYPVNLRYQRDYRSNPEALKRVLVPLPGGGHIPLDQLGTIEVKKGPPVIKSENARPESLVYVDLNTTDIGSYVAEARKVVTEIIQLPQGYSLTSSGQYV